MANYKDNFSVPVLPSNTRTSAKMNWTSFRSITGEIFRLLDGSEGKKIVDSHDVISTLMNNIKTSSSKESLRDILENIFLENDRVRVLAPSFLKLIEKNEEKTNKDKLVSVYLADLIFQIRNSSFDLSSKEIDDPLSIEYISTFEKSINANTDLKYRSVNVFRPIDFKFYDKIVSDIDFLIHHWDHEKSLNRIEYLLKILLMQHISYTFLSLEAEANNKAEYTTDIHWSFEGETISKSRTCYQKGLANLDIALSRLPIHHVILGAIKIELKEFKRYNELTSSDLNLLKNHLELRNSKYELDVSSFKGFYSSFRKTFGEQEKGKRSSAFDRPRDAWKTFITSNFTRKGGSLGNVLVVREEELIILVTLIVGQQGDEKVHIGYLWKELECRGFFFDSLTKSKVIQYLDRIGSLVSLSDSGDAKYVRKII